MAEVGVEDCSSREILDARAAIEAKSSTRSVSISLAIAGGKLGARLASTQLVPNKLNEDRTSLREDHNSCCLSLQLPLSSCISLSLVVRTGVSAILLDLKVFGKEILVGEKAYVVTQRERSESMQNSKKALSPGSNILNQIIS